MRSDSIRNDATGRVHRRCGGFTVVEVLAVITILALLVSLLLVAVVSAREASRRITCGSHLRQLVLATLAHEQTHRHLPTGGWGNRWVGDPDAGFGIRQPGGFVYNILPFMQQRHTRRLGQGLPRTDKQRAVAIAMGSAMPTFICPSRRSSGLGRHGFQRQMRNVQPPALVSKTDYAINGGSVFVNGGGGPDNSTRRSIESYAWPSLRDMNGVSFVRSRVRMRDIVDGASKTYLLGEKAVASTDGSDVGDDQSHLVGDDADIRRFASHIPISDYDAETERSKHFRRFGSSHAAGCYLAFCDGTVRFTDFGLHRSIHQQQGNRRDLNSLEKAHGDQ